LAYSALRSFSLASTLALSWALFSSSLAFLDSALILDASSPAFYLAPSADAFVASVLAFVASVLAFNASVFSFVLSTLVASVPDAAAFLATRFERFGPSTYT